MNMHSSTTPPATGSLLERAAAAYGFDDVATAQQIGAAALLRADHGGEIAIEELRENGYLLPDGPVTALAEEFRIVKRQLLLAAEANDRARLVMVASAAPDEGKTFCAINLAAIAYFLNRDNVGASFILVGAAGLIALIIRFGTGRDEAGDKN